MILSTTMSLPRNCIFERGWGWGVWGATFKWGSIIKTWVVTPSCKHSYLMRFNDGSCFKPNFVNSKVLFPTNSNLWLNIKSSSDSTFQAVVSEIMGVAILSIRSVCDCGAMHYQSYSVCLFHLSSHPFDVFGIALYSPVRQIYSLIRPNITFTNTQMVLMDWTLGGVKRTVHVYIHGGQTSLPYCQITKSLPCFVMYDVSCRLSEDVFRVVRIE